MNEINKTQNEIYKAKDMHKLSYNTVQYFCRACLTELNQRQKFEISCLNLQIRHWLEDVTLDDPLLHDIYSNSICQSCKNKLNEFVEFHRMYKQSKRTVDKLLNSNENYKLENNPIKISNQERFENVLLTFDCLTKTVPDSFAIVDDEGIKNVSPNINKHCSSIDCKRAKSEIEKSSCCNDVFIKSDNIGVVNNKNDTPVKDQIDNTCMISRIHNKSNQNMKLSDSKTERKKYIYSFHCDQCKYRSVSQQLLDIHMRIHYGLKAHQCPNCNDSFNKPTALLKHLNDIHGQKDLIIICEHEQCGREFTSSRSYKDHYRQNHLPQKSNEKQSKCTKKSPQRHICEECGKVYAKLQTFKEHQYTHQPKELFPFQCDVCDKAFVKRRTYNEHKLRHEGIKNFECPHCGAKRTTRKELREHINSHTRERQYPCPNCPMIFYRTSNRRVHIDVVHQGIRRFVCRYCDQTFGKGDNLKNHELLHTGEKPHVCSECGKRFVQRVSLRLHMKTHNKQQT